MSWFKSKNALINELAQRDNANEILSDELSMLRERVVEIRQEAIFVNEFKEHQIVIKDINDYNLYQNRNYKVFKTFNYDDIITKSVVNNNGTTIEKIYQISKVGAILNIDFNGNYDKLRTEFEIGLDNESEYQRILKVNDELNDKLRKLQNVLDIKEGEISLKDKTLSHLKSKVGTATYQNIVSDITSVQ